MEKGRTYYLKINDKVSDLKQFNLDESFIVNETSGAKKLVIIGDRKYTLEDELPIDNEKVNTVLGYVEAGKKENQQSSIKEGKGKLVGNIDSKYPILRNLEKGHKVVGYIKIDNMDSYVAITVKKQSLLPIGAIAVICLIGLMVFNMNSVNPLQPVDPNQFRDGNKGVGEIATNSETGLLETAYFNLNLNVTPTIQNDFMNLRVVNKEDSSNGENNLSFVVKVHLIATSDENGNELEVYEEPLLIYESPLINPSENIENCKLDIPVEQGRYVARAMYDIYDSNFYLVGQTAARLDIVSK